MRNNRRIRNTFLKVCERAQNLRRVIKEDYNTEICNFALSADVSNLCLEYENIIEELLKQNK